jgi:hypothetical protein
MRTLLLIPASLILTAACGLAGAKALGWRPDPAAMSLAGAVALGASVVALVPVLLARHATQLGMSQAALVATMAHLFACVAAAAVIVLGKFTVGNGFLYWLMAFYWMTLIALVFILARAVKSAPAAPATTVTTTPKA